MNSNDYGGLLREEPSTSGQIENGPRPGHELHEPTGTTEVMTFYPSWGEFKDFSGYIRRIEESGAHLKCGIAKIVPPPGFHPRPKQRGNYSNMDSYIIKEPVKETIEGAQGVYMKTNKIFKKELSVKEYRKLALSGKYKNPKPELSGSDLERHYWRTICQGEPVYGADTEGTVYEKEVQEWNMARLGTVLDEISQVGVRIKGVNTVYLYFGMWKTTFPWHAEDMDLYSINYLHFGAPKYWYAISSESADRFERLMQQQFPDLSGQCKAFLRHKNFIVSPTVLRNNNIPFGTMVQRPNEFIITFPRGYHMGFNSGYNCAESTNFASDRWIDYGKNAILCKCRPDSVEIDMRPFMKKYRPDEFDRWHDYWYGERPALARCRVTGKRIKAGPSSSARSASPYSKRAKGSSPASSASRISTHSIYATATVARTVGRAAQRRKKLAIKGLADLWASSPVNLFAERCWNERRALENPHCAVCQYFQPPAQTVTAKFVPESSRRLLSLLCFSKDLSLLPSVSDPAEDLLLTCDSCHVTVHRNCYAKVPQDSTVWRCLRCYNREDVLIRGTTCHLCELRGGAYIRCLAGQEESWVHVICAILSRRTSFADPLARDLAHHMPPPKNGFHLEPRVRLTPEYMGALGNEHEIAKFECELCGNMRESLAICAACEGDDESTLVHATCARLGRMYVERREAPLVAVLVCDRHDSDSDFEDTLPDVEPGENIIAWLNGGLRVERGFVMQKFKREYNMIDFLDGSVSRNTPSSDILSCECLKCDGKTHVPGIRVRVKWTDNKIYDGYYRRPVTETEFWVRLASIPTGPPCVLPRMSIYGEGERLPPEVRRVLLAQEKKNKGHMAAAS